MAEKKKGSVGVIRKGMLVKDQGFVPYGDSKEEPTPDVAKENIVVEWIKGRLSEPSSYAAIGAAVLGIGVLMDQPIVIVVGIVGGALAFFLKEKGVITEIWR